MRFKTGSKKTNFALRCLYTINVLLLCQVFLYNFWAWQTVSYESGGCLAKCSPCIHPDP